jgi:hypothetical protein
MKKKTVVLHPLLDQYVRKTQAILLDAEPEVDATYSTAINFMLAGFIAQAGQPEGLSPAARETMWEFAYDRQVVERLNLQDRLHHVRDELHRVEPPPGG